MRPIIEASCAHVTEILPNTAGFAGLSSPWIAAVKSRAEPHHHTMDTYAYVCHQLPNDTSLGTSVAEVPNNGYSVV
jgi:hypothetical protein